MNDTQVERLLDELARTRESFDTAITQIKWNRINTVIQYCLIVAMFVMGTLGAIYYLDEKHAQCERGNDLRMSITNSLDANAAAIGIALATVSGAPDDAFREYMEVYSEQDKPSALELREC